LNAKLKERELRINQLSAKQRSEEETKQLESFEQTRQRLAAADERVSELQSKLEETTEKWSQALGNEKIAVETIDELQSKHTKRWAEFTNAMEQGDIVQEEHTGEATPLDEKEAQAKQITQLQHKLNQAFENVRQAESTRENLKEALSMNESLQAKVDEFKAKYLAVQAGRTSANSRPSPSEPGSATPKEKDPSQTPREKEPSQTPREKDPSQVTNAPSSSADKPNSAPSSTADKPSSAPSSSADKPSSAPSDAREKAEKMHREHRRMRKELAAVTASKEAAKAKLERAEKERDGLMDANARLLKQISEKDEMNAKSLSTILHLKSMTDQVSTERDNLEQQTKNASQLAMAARLATNAKERVSEELVKEKEALSNRVEELEKEHKAKEKELVRIKSEWSNASSKIAALNSEISNTVKRSDELVAESEKKQEEIRKLVDSVAKTERQSNETKAKLDEAIKQSSGSTYTGVEESAVASSFTVDQLSTQVSVLKSRLACPVCHYRDKECIIMRCRHMHCRECVEGQMSSRSRKCPTCNNKFSEKDVEDIWLS
jgi:E3 ubiquitin-protein ligase BRE1